MATGWKPHNQRKSEQLNAEKTMSGNDVDIDQAGNPGKRERSSEATEFGDNLRSRRQRWNLTLDAMSRLTKLVDPAGAGISRVALSRYENGDSLPGLREIKILSLALRTPLASLVYGDADDPMNFMSPSIELVLQDLVADVVEATLERHGLIQKRPWQGPGSDEHLALVEKARKGD